MMRTCLSPWDGHKSSNSILQYPPRARCTGASHRVGAFSLLGSGPLAFGLSTGRTPTFSTGSVGPTASLMRNDLLNTACCPRIEERKGYKDAHRRRKAPKIEVAEHVRAK